MPYVHPKWNARSGSHTWSPRTTKMSAVPPGGKRGPSKTGPFRGLARRDWAEPLTIQLRFRGGAEAWWYVEARGRAQAFPGHMAIHDVMAVITAQYDGAAE